MRWNNTATSGPRVRARATALLAVILVSTPALAGPVHWPSPASDRDVTDPIISVRWSVARQWTVPSPVQLSPLLRTIDEALTQPDAPPVWRARRAVVLRLMDRADEARRDLDAAIAVDPRVLDDPDVGLTQAYLFARAQQFEPAVTVARNALGRLSPAAPHRALLAIEIARWSMARGAPGLPDALALLREVSALGAPEPMVRATLALALLRAGQTDEAREVARGGAVPQPYGAETLTPHGALLPGEPEAAVGAGLVLTNRGHDAVDLLARAATTVQPAWRAGLNDLLAQARRAPGTSPGTPSTRGAALRSSTGNPPSY